MSRRGNISNCPEPLGAPFAVLRGRASSEGGRRLERTAASLVHAVAGPLNVIGGRATLLALKSTDPTVRETTDAIQSQVLKLSAYLKQARAFGVGLVLATQNPIESEGTYNLPEAQLDRFLMRIELGYPEPADERSSHRMTRGTPATTHRRDRLPRWCAAGRAGRCRERPAPR